MELETKVGKVIEVPQYIKEIPERIIKQAIDYKESIELAIEYLMRCQGRPYVCKCGKEATCVECTVYYDIPYCDAHVPDRRLDPSIGPALAGFFSEYSSIKPVLTVKLDNWGAEGCFLRTSTDFLPRNPSRHGKLIDGRVCRVMERNSFGDAPEEFYQLIAVAKLAKKAQIKHLCASNGEIWTSPEKVPVGYVIIPWREVSNAKPPSKFDPKWVVVECVKYSHRHMIVKLLIGFTINHEPIYGEVYKIEKMKKINKFKKVTHGLWRGANGDTYKSYFQKDDERVLALINESL